MWMTQDGNLFNSILDWPWVLAVRAKRGEVHIIIASLSPCTSKKNKKWQNQQWRSVVNHHSLSLSISLADFSSMIVSVRLLLAHFRHLPHLSISESFSKPSKRPSPVVAEHGCICHWLFLKGDVVSVQSPLFIQEGKIVSVIIVSTKPPRNHSVHCTGCLIEECPHRTRCGAAAWDREARRCTGDFKYVILPHWVKI